MEQSWRGRREVWTVGVSPHASGTLYAGTQPAHLFVSQDTGETWREVDQFLQDARNMVPAEQPVEHSRHGRRAIGAVSQRG